MRRSIARAFPSIPFKRSSRSETHSLSEKRGTSLWESEFYAAARTACLADLKNNNHSYYLQHVFYPNAFRDAAIAILGIAAELRRTAYPSPLVERESVVFAVDSIEKKHLQYGAKNFKLEFIRKHVAMAFEDPYAARKARVPWEVLLGKHLGNTADKAPYLTRAFFSRWISAHERLLENPQVATLDALEKLADGLEGMRMFLLLESLGYRDQRMDHIATHLGRAKGLVNSVIHLPGFAKQSKMNIPLDLLARYNVKEEDVYRNGPNAEGLKDAVQDVVDLARSHLDHAREALKGEEKGWPVWIDAADTAKRLQGIEKNFWEGGLNGAGAGRFVYAWWRRKF